jgi:hypothetical protein
MWQDFTAWFQSPGGARVVEAAIIPALAIIVAAIVATLIARSAVKASMRRSERLDASSAIGALVAAARASSGSEHASRLRDEADVRTRLLPLPGAAVAADWAAARIDELQQRSTDAPGSHELDELRDRLVEWVGKPSRAKRLFGTPAAPSPTPNPRDTPAEPQAVEPEPTVAERVEQEAVASDRSARAAPGPRRTPPREEEPAAVATAAAGPEEAVAPEAVIPPAAQPSTDPIPAWQRTRAVERLQQERSRARVVEPPTVDEDEVVPMSTAPVQLAHPHRATGASSADADEAVRLEAHQQARHARPGDPAPAATDAAPAPAAAPAWLDTYDDEAQVTQNLDLKTPPPVAATAVRDRGAPGEDLVPRS